MSFNMVFKRASALLVLGGFSSLVAQANLTINATFDSSITSLGNGAAVQADIQQAINWYQTHITNNVTVSITFKNMTSELGQSNWFYWTDSYANVRAKMGAVASGSSVDSTALANLPASAPSATYNTIGFTQALGRTLGYNIGAGSDGTVSLNTAICFTTHNSPVTGKYDLYSVACHEINEVLGTPSGLFGTTPFVPDLFRYDNGARAFASGGSPYFSVDGTTNVMSYNNNGSIGDYGDWIAHPTAPGYVQDYATYSGRTIDMATPEITVLDAIGYNYAAVPEPGTWAVLGLGGLAMMRRRRKA